MDSINRFGLRHYILGGLLLVTLFFGAYSFFLLNTDKIHKGISAGDIDLSGLTKDQAIARLEAQRRDFDSKYLTLKYGNKTWQVPYNQLGAKYNIPEIVNKAYMVGRTGNYFTRVSDVLSARTGKKYNLVFDYNKQYLNNILSTIEKEINVPKRNAKILPNRVGATVIPHSVGMKLDFDNAVKLADNHVSKLLASEINLPVTEDRPTLLADNLKDMTDELGSFSTTFNTGDTARTSNIRLASSRINGTILKPGEVFSTDKALKNRTVSNGYKMSKAYLDDEVVDEIGGGVCQITTTLYGAVLYANLEVLERKPHTMMVDYVSPGFDATVSDKGIDFKFKNSYNMPIYLYSSVDGSKINMKIFGKQQDPTQRIQLESQVTDILYAQPEEVIVDFSAATGTRQVEVKSKNGYKASLYKNIYKNGVLEARQLVSENTYKPRRGKILIGR